MGDSINTIALNDCPQDKQDQKQEDLNPTGHLEVTIRDGRQSAHEADPTAELNSKPSDRQQQHWCALLLQIIDPPNPSGFISIPVILALLSEKLLHFSSVAILNDRLLDEKLGLVGGLVPLCNHVAIRKFNPIIRVVVSSITAIMSTNWSLNYSLLMFGGISAMVVSNLLYAFGGFIYTVLFVATAMESTGSAFVSIGALSILTEAFPNEVQRTFVIMVALLFNYTYLIRPIYLLMEFLCSWTIVRTLVLVLLAMSSAASLLIIPRLFSSELNKQQHNDCTFIALIKRRYILVTAAAIFVASSTFELFIIFIERLPDKEASQPNQVLVIVLIMLICLGALIAGKWVGNMHHHWGYALIGFLMAGSTLLSFILISTIEFMITIEIAYSIVLVTMVVTLGRLADRYHYTYGQFFAIGDVAVWAGVVLGLDLRLDPENNYHLVVIGIASLVCFAFAILLYKLKPEARVVDFDRA